VLVLDYSQFVLKCSQFAVESMPGVIHLEPILEDQFASSAAARNSGCLSTSLEDKTDTPRLSVVIRYVAQNQCVRGILVKNSPRGQRDLVPTASTLPASLVCQFLGSPMTASRADEAIGPSTGRQVLLASLLTGEVGLQLA